MVLNLSLSKVASTIGKVASTISKFTPIGMLQNIPVVNKVLNKTAEVGVPIAAGVGTGILTKSPTLGFAAGVGTGALIGALKTNPKKTVTAVGKTVTGTSNFLGNVGGFIVEPSVEKAKTTFRENPVITSLAGVGTVAAIGGGIGLTANTLATYLNTKATEKDYSGTVLETGSITTPTTKGTTDLGIPETSPLRETTTINTSKKRYKRHKTKELPSVRQSMRVNIFNKNSANRITKTYLNRQPLYN